MQPRFNQYENSIIEANNAKELVDYERKEFKRHEKLLSLAEQNLVDTVKHNINYFWSVFITASSKYLADKKSAELNDKKSYNFLNKTLTEALDIPIKVIEIVTHGFDTSGWTLKFIYNKTKFGLTVPNIENLTTKNIIDENYGKLGLGLYSNDSSKCIFLSVLATSYNIEDFIDIIKNTVTRGDLFD